MADSSGSGFNLHPHVALLPSAGPGHLTPTLRLAASLVDKQCRLTLITTYPTVSNTESQLIARFLSAYPQVSVKQFDLLPFDPSTANSTDPFCLRWEAIRRSAHLLFPLLSAISPPLSALICDVSLIGPVIAVTKKLSVPCYMMFVSSARMLSLLASFHTSAAQKIKSGSAKLTGFVEIPGLPSVPVSSIPPLLLNPETLFSSIFAKDGPELLKLNGIIVNTFEKLEPDLLDALNGGRVVENLPPVHAIGPLVPREFEKSESSDAPLKWLDDQPEESVVYVSFGSRAAMSWEQIRELGYGIMKSGYRFLWVVKTKKVDREEEEEGLDEVLGHELRQKMKDKGLVVKDWVDQNRILAHKAVGGFLSHCGWNSVVETTLHGMRMLVWPSPGDQRMIAEVVESVGMGLWVRSWGWNDKVPVKGEKIGEKIKEMMESELLREKTAKLREEARKAVSESGSCEIKLKELIEEWKTSERTK